ncbi:unnamed protein product [Nesidiocoris tenuis]|uniref:Uncharacterized protein n=1 Tax=Nesidiocoris tenuis TaxID=355587 RepID=A0A6H5H9V7_9HEMI|nr:unnamed protein product [Nesidiocoris tenuis]
MEVLCVIYAPLVFRRFFTTSMRFAADGVRRTDAEIRYTASEEPLSKIDWAKIRPDQLRSQWRVAILTANAGSVAPGILAWLTMARANKETQQSPRSRLHCKHLQYLRPPRNAARLENMRRSSRSSKPTPSPCCRH